MSEIKLNNKVWILEPKLDGSYNKGVVIGLEKVYDGLYIESESQFIKDHVLQKVKVAYVDVFTKRGQSKWFTIDRISKNNPIRKEDE